MQIIDLYKYTQNNVVIITPNKRNEADEPSRKRLIADDGYILTDGRTEVVVHDAMLDEVDRWHEINAETEATEADYINALERLGVNFSG